jgi:LEA14-like dessication related protein
MLAAGCVHPQALEPPKVSIIGVHVVSTELWMQHLKVRLRLHNPNDRELPVTAIEYTVEIAGQEVGSGSATQGFVVPPHGDAEFDSSVVTNVAAAALKLLSRGPRTLVPYRLAGKVSLAQGLGRVPFEEQASFTP